jgi:glycosyltransferase involved in cell wall biosynthesis
MSPAPLPLSATILICTYNRARRLREMLLSLAETRTVRAWDVMVVDNNSGDDTREVVESLIAGYPAPLFYVFEPRQGKSHALNSGIEQSRGDVIVMTDDDVLVGPEWVDASCTILDMHPDIDYSGGPVRPIWGAVPPAWLDQRRGDLWGTLAILDYGPAPFVFEERQRVPLGANMAVRRRLIERIGGFHPELGRRGRSLLGQEQAEFFARAREFGARGAYVPHMEVQHHVPAERLTKDYFRRWWYWKGVSRARVDAMHHRTELGLDLRAVPYLARVPRFIWGLLPRAIMRWVRAALTGRTLDAMRAQMLIAYAIGYVRACWSRESRRRLAPLGARQETASLSR